MSTPITTNIQSVTLKPGEKFTLPPGAKLLMATNADVIDSTCPIDEMEPTECFVTKVAAAGEEGNVDQYYENTRIAIVGYRYRGKQYLFKAPYTANTGGFFSHNDMAEELKAALGGVILKMATGIDSNDERGALTYLVIRTIASVAENLYLIVSTSIAPAQDGWNMGTELLTPFVKYADISGAGYNALPACPE